MTGMHPLITRMLFAGAWLSVALFQSECPAQGRDSGANPKAPVPPTLLPAPSPIQYFRKLLEAPAAEREQLLAGKSPEHRRVLTNSVRIYLALSPEDRERRLQAMELRHYLTRLIQLPATNRTLGLQMVPESFRTLVQQRLNYYDRLVPEFRQQLLDRGLPTPVVLTPAYPVRGFTSNQLADVDNAVKQWRVYAPAKRAEIAEKVTTSTSPEALSRLPLSDAERGQIEKALTKFANMKPAERQHVVKSFDKFAGLSPEERRQFLRNVEEWQKMSAKDRQRWRHIVNNIPPLPPLPVGFGRPPMPPMPKVITSPPRQELLVTNTNGI